MTVRLLFFAALRDITGKPSTEIVLTEGTSAGEVWRRLRRDYEELAGYEQPPLIAINEDYASADSILRDGDELAFIPPVAGG